MAAQARYVNYMLVVRPEPGALCQAVAAAMQVGWECTGGITVLPVAEGSALEVNGARRVPALAQAMQLPRQSPLGEAMLKRLAEQQASAAAEESEPEGKVS